MRGPNGVVVATAAEQPARDAERRAQRNIARGRIGAAVAARGQIARDFLGEVENRHALQPDMAGAGEAREEQAFAAEPDVPEAEDHLDFEADAGLEHAQHAVRWVQGVVPCRQLLCQRRVRRRAESWTWCGRHCPTWR